MLTRGRCLERCCWSIFVWIVLKLASCCDWERARVRLSAVPLATKKRVGGRRGGSFVLNKPRLCSCLTATPICSWFPAVFLVNSSTGLSPSRFLGGSKAEVNWTESGFTAHPRCQLILPAFFFDTLLLYRDIAVLCLRSWPSKTWATCRSTQSREENCRFEYLPVCDAFRLVGKSLNQCEYVLSLSLPRAFLREPLLVATDIPSWLYDVDVLNLISFCVFSPWSTRHQGR